MADGIERTDDGPLRRLACAAGPQALRRKGTAGRLLVEWPADEKQPARYFFSNLPSATSLRRLVAVARSRWLIEHGYRELKDELGLDHFEGRSWQGWNHPVLFVLLACAFLQNPRCRQKKWRSTDPAVPARATPVTPGLLVRPMPTLRQRGPGTHRRQTTVVNGAIPAQWSQ